MKERYVPPIPLYKEREIESGKGKEELGMKG